MKHLLITLTCISFLFLLSCTSTRDLGDLSLENNQYSFSGKPFSGKAIKYSAEGEKIAEYTVQEGTKAGPFKEWHPNGKLHRSGTIYQWSDGEGVILFDGMLNVYNSEGEQIIQENYKQGFLITEFEVFLSADKGKLWMDRNSTSAATLNRTSDNKFFGLFYYKTDDQNKEEVDLAVCNSNKLIWKGSNEATSSELPPFITPCPPGYRLPYPGELEKEIPMEKANKKEAALSSGLKLPAAGKWNRSKKQVEEEGESGNYWVKSELGYQIFYFDEHTTSYKTPQTSYGYSARCLFDLSETLEFEPVRRNILRYGPSERLTLHIDSQSGTISVRFCLDKNGIVVFRYINEEKTTIQKESLQNLGLSIFDEFIFASDPTAPQVECGDYTFRIRLQN